MGLTTENPRNNHGLTTENLASKKLTQWVLVGFISLQFPVRILIFKKFFSFMDESVKFFTNVSTHVNQREKEYNSNNTVVVAKSF